MSEQIDMQLDLIFAQYIMFQHYRAPHRCVQVLCLHVLVKTVLAFCCHYKLHLMQITEKKDLFGLMVLEVSWWGTCDGAKMLVSCQQGRRYRRCRSCILCLPLCPLFFPGPPPVDGVAHSQGRLFFTYSIFSGNILTGTPGCARY